MIFVVCENYVVMGTPPVTPKSDIRDSSFCRAHHAIFFEKEAKLAIMPSLCVCVSCNNEDCPLHKQPTVKQRAAEFQRFVALSKL